MNSWATVALELRCRAAQYCSVQQRNHGQEPPLRQSGFFLWEHLKSILSQPPEPNAWWWVYAPLLIKLLEGGASSRAILVCLGHHIGSGDAEVEPERQWIHFLPADFSGKEGAPALARLKLFVSYNAEFLPAVDRTPVAGKARPGGGARGLGQILTTTAFLEKLSSRCAQMLRSSSSTPKGHPSTHPNNPWQHMPLLWPLFLNFEPGLADMSRSQVRSQAKFASYMQAANMKGPFLTADWATLRQRILDSPSAGKRALAARVTRVAAALIERGNQDGMVPCDLPPADHEFLKDTYETEYLDPTHERLGQELGDELVSTVLGQPGEDSAPVKWLTHAGFTKEEIWVIAQRWLRFSIWLHDLTDGPAFGQVFSMLSWLPPSSRGIHSGSIIVYSRAGHWMLPALELHDPISETASMCATFHAGSAFMIDEQASDREQQRQASKVGQFLNEFAHRGGRGNMLIETTLGVVENNGRSIEICLWGLAYAGEMSVLTVQCAVGARRLALLVEFPGHHFSFEDVKLLRRPNASPAVQSADVDQVAASDRADAAIAAALPIGRARPNSDDLTQHAKAAIDADPQASAVATLGKSLHKNGEDGTLVRMAAQKFCIALASLESAGASLGSAIRGIGDECQRLAQVLQDAEEEHTDGTREQLARLKAKVTGFLTSAAKQKKARAAKLEPGPKDRDDLKRGVLESIRDVARFVEEQGSKKTAALIREVVSAKNTKSDIVFPTGQLNYLRIDEL